jgi:hypothetical protein
MDKHLCIMYEGRPENKDRLAIKKNKKKNYVSLLQTLSYFST